MWTTCRQRFIGVTSLFIPAISWIWAGVWMCSVPSIEGLTENLDIKILRHAAILFCFREWLKSTSCSWNGFSRSQMSFALLSLFLSTIFALRWTLCRSRLKNEVKNGVHGREKKTGIHSFLGHLGWAHGICLVDMRARPHPPAFNVGRSILRMVMCMQHIPRLQNIEKSNGF